MPIEKQHVVQASYEDESTKIMSNLDKKYKLFLVIGPAVAGHLLLRMEITSNKIMLSI